jgi:hypothetical protein
MEVMIISLKKVERVERRTGEKQGRDGDAESESAVVY